MMERERGRGRQVEHEIQFLRRIEERGNITINKGRVWVGKRRKKTQKQ